MFKKHTIMIEEKYINRGVQHINYMTGLSGFNKDYLNFRRDLVGDENVANH